MMRRLALALIALPLCASAAVIHVPADQPTVQAGIDAAVAGDEVVIACGIYDEHDIVMKSGITLRGETGAADCVWIDAQQQGRVIIGVDLDASTLVAGITFTGGVLPDEEYDGAGARFESSSLRIEHCRFTGNYSWYKGGGASFGDCPAVIQFCRFDANSAEDGGGGALQAYRSELSISDCSFEHNDGIDGGAVILSQCAPLFERCLFLNNDAWFWGGGVMCGHEASPSLRGCTLVGNDAYEGGGVWAVADSHPTLEHCIVAFSTDGAGLFVPSGGSGQSTILATCSDVYHNVGGDYGGLVDDQTGVDGNFSANPLFCDQLGGDFSLAAGSPCLPAGNGCNAQIGAFGEGCAFPTAAETQDARAIVLMQNRPNPFNPSTEIAFGLPAPARVSLAIFDLGGRRLRVLLRDAERPAGESRTVWDGRDEAGRALPTGVYLYRLETPEASLSRKLTLLK